MLKSFTVFMLLSLTIVQIMALELTLPAHIYAVPGVESNVYFDNVVLTVNPANYVFDVDCTKGRNDQKRWSFIPTAQDVGEHDWHIKISDGKKIVAEGKTKLIVSPTDAGNGKSISILIVGDSLTNASHYPKQLHKLMQSPENPKLTMIGSHSGAGRPVEAGGVAHEGYGGWGWKTFLTHFDEKGKQDYRSKSKFITVKNGQPTLDFQAFLDRYNDGKAPDYITVMLGINDIFGAQDDNLQARITDILNEMDKLLAEFRRVAPDAIIGVALPTPGAASQDAFGNNYKCGQTRWQFKKNQHFLVAAMIKKLATSQDKKLSLIPTPLNLDCENNFPTANQPINNGNPNKTVRQNNGVHPAPAGYAQIGDTFYCWLKYQLNKGVK